MNTPTTVRRGFPWTYTLLAYGFSWLIWSPAVLANARIITAPLPVELLTALVIMLGAFGPLIAALVMTRHEGGRR